MPDESAEVASTRHRSTNVVALATLIVVIAAIALWQRPWADAPAGSDGLAYPTDAAAQLTELAQELTAQSGIPRAQQALGPDRTAAVWAQQISVAMDSLDVTDVRWRYLSGGDRPLRGDGSSSAQFEVTTAGGRSSEFTARIRPSAGGTISVTGVESAKDPLPLWLAGAVQINRSDATTVVQVREPGTDFDAEIIASLDLERAAATARARVLAVVDDADRQLTVVVASSQRIAAQILGRPPAAVDQIAGVATDRDGRDGTVTGRVVVLNPKQFEPMDARAAQIVLTHEATHVMTAAVDTSAEPWVVEGFADLVALRRDTAPLNVSAGQILTQVAASQAPRQLPTREQFASDAKNLSAVYESAWFAMRSLSARHPQADVVAFYRRVVRGTSVASAASSALDESVASITAAWREDLQREASRLAR